MLSFSQYIKQECLKIGFDDCAISKATSLPIEKESYKKWIAKAYHGKMKYLENNLDMRFNPDLLLPGTKSIVSVILNYYPKEKLTIDNNYRIAKYAYGQDYHFVIKEMLQRVAENCQQKYGDFQYRAFTDSAPIPDRLWAKKGGLGWTGKNTLLINKVSGSFFLIGHLFIDWELEADRRTQEDLCLDCDKCLKACPTNALFEPYQMDATKCLSYQSIENKSAEKDIPPKKFRNWIFGCDICQDVCPFNKNPIPTTIDAFQPHPQLLHLHKEDWQQMKPMDFGEIFRDTPVKRAGYKGLKQNVSWVKDS
jgi:epoxyqueuosine reductase